MLRYQRKNAEAIIEFQKAIELRPDYVMARLALAQLQVTRGEFEAALKSDTLVFHCNTCDTDWTPSGEEIAKIRKEFSR